MAFHRRRTDTRTMILEAIADNGEALTRTKIAQVLNRKKSPNLIAILDEMVTDGLLTWQIVTFHNGVQGYAYSLTDKARTQLAASSTSA